MVQAYSLARRRSEHLITSAVAPAHAATVSSISLPGPKFSRADPLFSEAAAGPTLAGPEDFFPDRAEASADARTGRLRAFALDGGLERFTPSSARAEFRDRFTVTAPAGAAPELATARLWTHARIDNRTIETGGPVGGSASSDVSSFLFVDVTERVQRRNVGQTGSIGFRQMTGYDFRRGENPSIIDSATAREPFISELGFVSPGRVSGGQFVRNPVREARLIFEQNTTEGLLSLMEIDFLAIPGARMRVGASLSVAAYGTVGHASGVDARNTAALYLDLPDGFGFVPDIAGFLSEQSRYTPPGAGAIAAPTPVPLPASGVLLAGAVGALGLARLRRRPGG